MTALLEDAWPVARKAHGCSICLGRIASGETYNRQRLIWDDGPVTFKSHALCNFVYWRAYRELGLMDDEAPDFTDEILPGLLAFFRMMSVFTFITPGDES